MYFNLVPNIVYDEKPIKYPFSESDRIVAKNFFRRYKLNDEVFSTAVFFNKYMIKDGERPDMVADKVYGNPMFDWVILLSNNLVNAHFDWPMSNYEISKILEREYDDAYTEIKYYRTIDIGQYPAGLRVDEAFFNRQHKINFGAGGIQLVNGSAICGPVSVARDFTEQNEKKRRIYLLKPLYFRQFVNDFKKNSQYKPSSNFINQRLKETG
tara:strand:+ start:673 stop:1305 length:633 start_codon:yes stop_codon:yes gene_type:complete